MEKEIISFVFAFVVMLSGLCGAFFHRSFFDIFLGLFFVLVSSLFALWRFYINGYLHIHILVICLAILLVLVTSFCFFFYMGEEARAKCEKWFEG